MAENTSLTYELVIPEKFWDQLSGHLFPGDHDEHGAVLAAGMAKTGNKVRLLVRHVFLAVDGIDYLPGQRGYRMLTADFVRNQALFCRDEKLAYLAVHNHGGTNSVAFSDDDLRSHERGYPALKDITRGQIVGALVFAENAVAGDLWLSHGREPLRSMKVIGKNIFEVFPEVPRYKSSTPQKYDRQARMFGDKGQDILRHQRIGVIGLGGVGSLVSEYLARLGVGTMILVDPDTLEESNTSRVVGSEAHDSTSVNKITSDIGLLKIDIAGREARRANPKIEIIKHSQNVVEREVAVSLTSCDFIFLAADSMQARLLFNAIVHQYLIPGVQLGSKVPVDPKTGEIGRIFSVARPVLPGYGCLWCNGLISSDRLQTEALNPEERRAQQYVQEDDIPAPSVITLNALAAAHGVNDYLFRIMGLRNKSASDDYAYIEPRTSRIRLDQPRIDQNCTECGYTPISRFARGDARSLPTRGK